MYMATLVGGFDMTGVHMTADSAAASVGPVRRRGFAADVADRIRTMIFDGRLKAGQRVPQEAIALELGVSRVPVREALIALEENGLVVAEHQRGVFVEPIRREDIEDHYRMYGMIQALAAVRAAERVTEPVLTRLRDLHEQMVAIPEGVEAHALNAEFHAMINRVGGSRRVRSMLRHLARNLASELFLVPPAVSPAALADHAAIIGALRDGDVETLERVNREHLRREGEAVVAELLDRGVLID
jgi:DNA-binding GntR family transcriptional regulator